jgi:hypothetical protein
MVPRPAVTLHVPAHAVMAATFAAANPSPIANVKLITDAIAKILNCTRRTLGAITRFSFSRDMLSVAVVTAQAPAGAIGVYTLVPPPDTYDMIAPAHSPTPGARSTSSHIPRQESRSCCAAKLKSEALCRPPHSGHTFPFGSHDTSYPHHGHPTRTLLDSAVGMQHLADASYRPALLPLHPAPPT